MEINELQSRQLDEILKYLEKTGKPSELKRIMI